jgi:hypothetical protein
VLANAGGKGSCNVAACPVVDQGPFAVVEVQSGGQAQRPPQLDFEFGGSLTVLFTGNIGEHVDIRGKRRPGPDEVTPGPVNDAPAMGLDIHCHLHEQGRRPADGVRTHSAAGELGQERQMRTAKFPADNPGGFDRVLPGPWSEGGGGHLPLR